MTLPRDWSSVAEYEQLWDEEASGLHYTLGISVSIGPDLVGTQTGGDCSQEERLNSECEDEMEVAENTNVRKGLQHCFLNMLVRSIIRKVPRKRLKYFQ